MRLAATRTCIYTFPENSCSLIGGNKTCSYWLVERIPATSLVKNISIDKCIQKIPALWLEEIKPSPIGWPKKSRPSDWSKIFPLKTAWANFLIKEKVMTHWGFPFSGFIRAWAKVSFYYLEVLFRVVTNPRISWLGMCWGQSSVMDIIRNFFLSVCLFVSWLK